ncbi:Lipoprotein-releasing system ATP-binding protein LolD [hydrothermal vent metagenome]|uniref:Lipoprotein-releasing system ATP-binding protein LolD n=1 Tax=hydrothermal vent metagenome TaxID=652676 RepID=A0A3B1D6M3_9ZZZZ
MLTAKNIHKSYHQVGNELNVLQGVDLEINEGEMVAIVGPSGAGKSTLLHILGGLDTPDKGCVRLQGDNIYRLKDSARAKVRNRRMGFVFQFYHLLPEFTALENVVLPILIKENQKNPKKFKDQGMELLAQMGIEERASHKPKQLSGGEQQRVAIARALVNQPDIIFCDEPTGNLDSHSGDEIINLLMDLNKKNKQTFIIVTHDESIAKRCHRVVHMKDGRLE